MRVLDVGGGLGGPARMLAVEYGARVTVFNLTADYLRTGALLTARRGLAGQVHFCHGQALALPFADGSFDLVWTQNSGMQLADKSQLYCDFFRVLRPGGCLAQLEPVAGPVQPPHFPLMWTSEPSQSHVLTADALYATITATGFIAFGRHLRIDSMVFIRYTEHVYICALVQSFPKAYTGEEHASLNH